VSSGAGEGIGYRDQDTYQKITPVPTCISRLVFNSFAIQYSSLKIKMARTFTLASRASQLAQVQTNIVLESLQKQHSASADAPSFATSFMATGGDKNQSQALYLLGGKALWTKELEVALKERDVDMLVHSLKDVPTTLPDGCILGAILEREDPVDSLVVKQGESWKTLDDLPAGSVVGTSSVRRVAQLKRKYPSLKFLDVVSTVLSYRWYDLTISDVILAWKFVRIISM